MQKVHLPKAICKSETYPPLCCEADQLNKILLARLFLIRFGGLAIPFVSELFRGFSSSRSSETEKRPSCWNSVGVSHTVRATPAEDKLQQNLRPLRGQKLESVQHFSSSPHCSHRTHVGFPLLWKGLSLSRTSLTLVARRVTISLSPLSLRQKVTRPDRPFRRRGAC